MESDVTAIFAQSEENTIDEENFETYSNEENVHVSFSNETQIESSEQVSEWADICRLCANSNDHIIPIFEAEGAEHNLCEKIHKYLPIRVSIDDTLPIQLCYHCAATILAWHELLEGCLSAQKQLLQMQVSQSQKEPTETNNDENLSEELVDDPEPVNIKKEQTCSISQSEEEAEHSASDEKATKRSQEQCYDNTDLMAIGIDNIEMTFNDVRTKNVSGVKSDDRFDEISELVEHTKNMHDAQDYHCQYCGLEFHCSEENFRQHVENHEYGMKSVDTDGVDNFYILPDHYEEIETEEGSFARGEDDDNPGETLEETSLVDKSIVSDGDVVEYHCRVCDLFVPISRIDFLRHIRTHWKYGKYECNLCNEIFFTEYLLFKHKNEAHLAKESSKNSMSDSNSVPGTTTKDDKLNEDPKTSYMCEFCGKKYSSLANLRTHQTHVHAALKLHMCDMCERNFTSESTLENHRRLHARKQLYTCPWLKKSIVELAESTDFTANKETKIKTEYPIEILDRTKNEETKSSIPKSRRRRRKLKPDEPNTLVIHKPSGSLGEEMTGADVKKKRRKRRIPDDPYVCDLCGKQFRLRGSLKRHLRLHSGVKHFTCHICGKQFIQNGCLYYHLKHLHGGVKNHSCDICGRSFAMKTAMEDHRRSIHTGERPYGCDTCGKTFASKSALYIHRKIHTQDYPYECKYCKKKFRWKQQLMGHLTTHTGEKNHTCDICGRAFGVKNQLSRHRLTHATDKPYTCGKCGMTFGQKRYLTNHDRSKHR